MLKVSIHAGALDSATRYNQLAWLDIGYEALAPIATYKTLLFQNGVGASVPTPIYDYPRWSASLWDLVARAIALGLRTDLDCLNEEVPVVESPAKRWAYARQICAFIDHVPSAGEIHRRTLASAEITMVGRVRGTYVARFEEHTLSRFTTEQFEYRPAYLRPAELLLHACLYRLGGKAEFPPRPALNLPKPLSVDGRSCVPIHRLTEPARTGFSTWLHHIGKPPIEHAGAPHGIAPEQLYLKFLAEAV